MPDKLAARVKRTLAMIQIKPAQHLRPEEPP
jgi:hypothetical protein